MAVKYMFVGDAQMSRYHDLYRMSGGVISEGRFFDVAKVENLPDLTSMHEMLRFAEIVVLQCGVFSSNNIFEQVIRGVEGGAVIRVPNIKIRGLHALERVVVNDVKYIDGAEILHSAIDEVGVREAVGALMAGRLEMREGERLDKSLNDLSLNEISNADVKISDYIRGTWRKRRPAYAIDAPSQHVLAQVWGEIVSLSDGRFRKLSYDRMSVLERGRLALSSGAGVLSPWTVKSLKLKYSADVHWYARLMSLAGQVVKGCSDCSTVGVP